MIYNDRVDLITYAISYDALGSKVETPEYETKPCSITKLSHNQQMGIFGSYKMNALKIHLLGTCPPMKEVRYQGITRSIIQQINHKNATVLVI